MAARRNPAFAQVLVAADLCTPDGIGVLWAARLAGVRLNERVTGSDGIYRLCERAAAQGVARLLPRRRPRRSRTRRRRTDPSLSRSARRRHIRRLTRRHRLAADPPAPRRRARRSALRRLRPSPPGHLDSTTQSGVAGRSRARRRRRLRLRRRHHPPRPAPAAPPRPRMAIPPRPPTMALAPHGRPAPVRAAVLVEWAKQLARPNAGP